VKSLLTGIKVFPAFHCSYAFLFQAYFNGENAESVAGDFGKNPLYKMLGYFSLIALLRVHSMLGDYYLAVKVLENIDLHKNVSTIPIANITLGMYETD